MRMTIELPDPLFKEIKVDVATRGITMKDFVVLAVQRKIVRTRQEDKRRRSRQASVDSSKRT